VSRAIGCGDFSAEAAIVNFYHMDSTLSGHTDHSEPDKKAPLFSFRFAYWFIFSEFTTFWQISGESLL